MGPLLLPVFLNGLPALVMAKSFGYADDFEIVGSNPVFLGIDVKKVWKWCKENLVSIN